ncbi:MAG TPA: tetratricopeptide repeat protein [Candidatus Polarisedimenticolaceae bacterium]|nr:tetratricopeptide repeat protein [Candidatus Polarisedimenticolaceae bacterium]
MSPGLTRKNLKQDEIVDAALEAGHWLERHRRNLTIGGGAVLVVVLAALGWTWLNRRSQAQAAELLGEALQGYHQAEQAGFQDTAALDAILAKFQQAADRGGASNAAAVARFYAAATAYRLKRHNDAITWLEPLAGAGTAPSLRDTARMMLARVYVEAGQADKAVALLTAALIENPPPLAPDQVLLELGRIEQARGKTDDARRAWQRVADEYADSPGAQEAQALLRPQGGA